MNALFAAIVLLVLPLLIAAGTFAFVHRMDERSSGWKRIGACTLHGAIALAALTLLNGWPGYFQGNADTYAFADGWSSAPPARSTALRSVVRIDNSGNKMLIPDPMGNEEDSTVLVVTDRNKLAQLLERLHTVQENIGMVVVDITFPEASTPTTDSTLRAAILPFVGHNGILLAQDREPNTPLLSFDGSAMARVTERTQRGTIAWHDLEEDGAVSLPYQLYLRLNGMVANTWPGGLLRERGVAGGLAFGGFVPTWEHVPPSGPTTVGSAAATSRTSDRPLPIGYALGAGWPELVARLSGSPADKPVVFIGEFSGASSASGADLHRTLRGTQRGADLLIALFHDLEQGAHRVRGASLLFQFLVLVLCSWLVFRQQWVKPRSAAAKTMGYWTILFQVLWRRVVDLLPILILVLTGLALRGWFQQNANLAALVVYFLALNALLRASHLARRNASSPAPRT